jgi:predicted dehydrogenase
MVRTAIIGCGRQADAHALPISEISDCELVAVCDSDELMAKQLAERFSVTHYFTDVTELLAATRPDVVHVATPPHSHLALGRLCLNAGCHVFFEKPFTLNSEQATELVELARARDRKITVGHNNQFNHVSRRLRRLVEDGALGGPPVHLESVWCYDLGDKSFAAALLGDKEHWVRKLPGQLLHNIISHGIGRIAEFLHGEHALVIAHGFRSPLLESIGETDIIDELRVTIVDDRNTTAYFTFSTQISPRIQQFRVLGPGGGLVIDDLHQTLITVNNSTYKYYLNHFIPPLLYARQYAANARANITRFIRRDFHFESGRKRLIEAFYRAVTVNGPLPLSYREILMTSRIMDDIFRQVGRASAGRTPAALFSDAVALEDAATPTRVGV